MKPAQPHRRPARPHDALARALSAVRAVRAVVAVRAVRSMRGVHGLRGARQRTIASLLAGAMTLGALAPGLALAQVRLPSLGESASDDLSVSAERRIGLEIMRQARRDPLFLDDPLLQAYIVSLWQPLLDAARARGEITPETDQAFAWEAFLVLDRSVNAFAMPGGYIGVHLGLIAITQTRDQLASVLAHELAHVTQRHIARSISVQQQASLLSIATTILGILAASRSSNIDAASAAIYGGQAVAMQGQLNYSREMEREADRIGYTLLGSAGFSTIGMAQMFERMDQANRLNDSGAFPYLRSHPLTVERMSEARTRTLLPGSTAAAPPLLHALMQARARVLMDPSVQGLQRLNGESSSPQRSDQFGALYAGAMGALLLNDPARGDRLAQAALSLHDALPEAEREPAAAAAVQLLRSQLLLAARDTTGALRVVDAAASEGAAAPALLRRPLLLQRAQAVLELHRQQGGAAAAQLRRSTETLQTWLADHPEDASVWQMLSFTTDAGGLRLRSLRAAAEARAAVGDLNGAIDRLRVAQAATRGTDAADFIEASVIDARLRQLEGERRQLMVEARGGR